VVDLASLLDRGCIILDLKAKKKRDAINELVYCLHQEGRITEPEEVATSLLQREELSSTGIGHGIAVPHVLTEKTAETQVALGMSRTGIPYQSIDGRPVHLVFLILGPEGAEYAHLQLLSRLARFLNDDTFRRSLLEAVHEEKVVELFRKKEKGKI